MELCNLNKIGDWHLIKKAALTTIHKRSFKSAPASQWKKQILLAEHSPIRMMQFCWSWLNIKHWVAGHFARHHVGVEKFISTQRSDRTGVDRATLSQDAEQDMMMCCNAQALINISRKRLCNCASAETRKAWSDVRDKIAEIEPELASVMVRECIYRGFCPEINCCGYCHTEDYANELIKYRKIQ